MKFLKDGYTDIQGKFKYITRDLDTIVQFNILFETEAGAVTKLARKPNLIGSIN